MDVHLHTVKLLPLRSTTKNHPRDDSRGSDHSSPTPRSLPAYTGILTHAATATALPGSIVFMIRADVNFKHFHSRTPHARWLTRESNCLPSSTTPQMETHNGHGCRLTPGSRHLFGQRLIYIITHHFFHCGRGLGCFFALDSQNTHTHTQDQESNTKPHDTYLC